MNATTKLTASKARKILTTANIAAEVNGAGSRFEIETPDEKTMRKVMKAIPGLGGYKCGWGGWVLSPSIRNDGKDYCDPTSRAHY